MSDNYQRRLSRRDAIKLMGALSASVAMVGCVYPDVDDSDLLAGEWPELDLPPLPGPGYGTDPILVNPEPAPWKLSLTQAQLNLAAELAEAICPGAIEAGVPDVLNEWLSAPYPKQADDRELLLAGLGVKRGERPEGGLRVGEIGGGAVAAGEGGDEFPLAGEADEFFAGEGLAGGGGVAVGGAVELEGDAATAVAPGVGALGGEDDGAVGGGFLQGG